MPREIRRSSLLLAGVALLGAPTLSQAQASPSELSKSVREVAVQLQRQADLGMQTAKEIRATPNPGVEQKLKEAEARGVGVAWYPRFEQDPAARGEGPGPAVLDRGRAAKTLTDQSRALSAYARQLEGIVLSPETPADVVAAKLAKLKPPPAAAIVFGSTESAPFIVGPGSGVTVDYPAVAALVMEQGGQQWVACTGTLISARVVLTAAHCVKGEAELKQVFFQSDGIYGVTAVVPHLGFRADAYRTYDDVALIQLDRPVRTIRPAALAASSLNASQFATIVGYGRHNALTGTGSPAPGAPLVQITGLKLAGKTETRPCAGVPNAAGPGLICWQFKGVGPAAASTCHGDSGGPLFAQYGPNWALAGVTAYGVGDLCQPQSYAVDMDVLAYRDWIGPRAQALDPHPEPPLPTALNAVENQGARFALRRPYQLLAGGPTPYSFSLPPGAGPLRITLNGANLGAVVKMTATGPQAGSTCQASHEPPLLSCQVPTPAAGDWTVTVEGVATQEIQIAAVRD